MPNVRILSNSTCLPICCRKFQFYSKTLFNLKYSIFMTIISFRSKSKIKLYNIWLFSIIRIKIIALLLSTITPNLWLSIITSSLEGNDVENNLPSYSLNSNGLLYKHQQTYKTKKIISTYSKHKYSSSPISIKKPTVFNICNLYLLDSPLFQSINKKYIISLIKWKLKKRVSSMLHISGKILFTKKPNFKSFYNLKENNIYSIIILI